MKTMARLSGLLVLFSGVIGCGDDRTSLVRGSVSIDGERITFGTIAFIGPDGRVDSTMIRDDGTYEMLKAPQGKVLITVQTYPLPPQVRPPEAIPTKGDKAAATPTGARYTLLPDYYSDEKKSPLTYTVVPGPQEYDIQLSRPAKGASR
ncbi:hypothetical protein [Zavarzinella formosa]|uniref:hypothetical protein n=1 Tax=Zavarzinella formosa TaxID=360055 RepID=UPI0002EEA75F|nr:hypothetical protein [Zavarzinella formosa]